MVKDQRGGNSVAAGWDSSCCVGSSVHPRLLAWWHRLTLKFSATKYLWLWAVSLWLSRSEFSALIFPLDTSGTRRAALRISPRQQLHANAHLSTTITNCFVFCRFILFGLCERSWSKRRLLWWEVKLFWVPGGFSRTFSTNWVITGSEKSEHVRRRGCCEFRN